MNVLSTGLRDGFVHHPGVACECNSLVHLLGEPENPHGVEQSHWEHSNRVAKEYSFFEL